MPDLYTSGVYVKPLDLFPFSFGSGNGDHASSNTSRSRSSERSSEGKDDFKALQTMEVDLRNAETMLDYQKSMMGMAAANAIKGGTDPSTALNQYFSYLLQNKQSQSLLAVSKNRATRQSEKLEDWEKDVSTRKAGNNLVLRQVGPEGNPVMIPVIDPFTNEMLTFNKFRNVAESLNFSENPGVYGKYPVVNPETGKVLRDRNNNPVFNNWTIEPPVVPHSDQTQTYLKSKVDDAKSEVVKLFGGGTDLTPEHRISIGKALLVRNTEWQKDSNAKALYGMAANFIQGMDEPTRNAFWNEFYQAAGRGEVIRIDSSMYEEPKKGKKNSVPVFDYAFVNKLHEDQLQAKKDKDEEKFLKLENDEMNYINNAFNHYVTVRLYNEVEPVVNISGGEKPTYTNIGGSASDQADSNESLWHAVQTNNAYRYGLGSTERQELITVDKKGNVTSLSSNDPQRPVLNNDPLFQKSYMYALKGLISGKGTNVAPWNFDETTSKAVNDYVHAEWLKQFPQGDMFMISGVDGHGKDADVYSAMYQNFKQDMYDKWLFEHMPEEHNAMWKEMMIPGSINKPKGEKSKGFWKSMGNIAHTTIKSFDYKSYKDKKPKAKDQSTVSRPEDITYEEAIGHNLNDISKGSFIRTWMVIPMIPANSEKMGNFGIALRPGDTPNIAGRFYKSEDLQAGDGSRKNPIVVNITGILPAFPDANRRVQNTIEGTMLMSKKMLENVMVDDAGTTLADLDEAEMKEYGIIPITNAEKLFNSEKVEYARQNGWGGESGYLVPMMLPNQAIWNQDIRFNFKKKDQTDNLGAEHRATVNAAKKVNLDDMYNYVTQP